MKSLYRRLSLLAFFLLSLLGLSQNSLAQAIAPESHTFMLPAGQSTWQSASLQTDEPFDFIGLQTNSFEDHLELKMQTEQGGAMLELHDEFGEGLETMMTTDPATQFSLRYQGEVLLQPVKITVHLFPRQENQELLDPLVTNLEIGGDENRPIIIPRSAWGADESLRYIDQSSEGDSGPSPCAAKVETYPQDYEISHRAEGTGEWWERSYSAEVNHLIVHHTVTNNLEVDSPAIVRSIYSYHALTRGWGDIGYNYLIDADGNIYEGRAGGEHNGMPVVGGHALCSNVETIGMALIGNYQENTVPGPMLDSLSDLLAYFSDKYQLDPLGQSLWHGEMKPTIGGHRDFQSTACPGQYMYDLLPSVREATELKLQSTYSMEFDLENLPYNAEAMVKEQEVSLNPNERKTLTVAFKNTGTQAWTNQTWLYGVSSAPNLTLPLVADKPFVLANLKENKVDPGDTGTFQVKLQAPFRAGEHVLYMVPVLNNNVKVSRASMAVSLTVEEPILTYQVIQQNLPSGSVKAGEALKNEEGNWYSLYLKNTGNTPWQKENTALYGSSPNGRSSLFSGSPLMANLVEAQVAPNEVGQFTFQGLKAPTTQSGEIVEQFTPAIRDTSGTLHWMPNQALGFGVNIVGGLSTTFNPNVLTTLPFQNTGGNLMRVKLSYEPSADAPAVVTSDQVFYLQNTKGGPYLKVPAGQTVMLQPWWGHLSFTTSDYEKAIVSGLRMIPSKGGILEIRSWEHRPSWNLELNDNQFRGTLEFRPNPDAQNLLTINELPLEDYLKGVAEVSNGDHPEKQKVLAVLARSYAQFYLDPNHRKFPGQPYDGSDDPDVFQKYLGYGYEQRSNNFAQAVQATAGQVVTHNGALVKTPYFNESDGRTRSAEEVWGWTDTPYLQSVEDSWCKEGEGELKGHGVGLSGCGASAMAAEGKSFVEIIEYYYAGVKVGRQ